MIDGMTGQQFDRQLTRKAEDRERRRNLRRAERLDRLVRLGFDRSAINEEDGTIRVSCSQCAALVINDTACHETGCPNRMHECHGCPEIIPIRQRWCSDCQ